MIYLSLVNTRLYPLDGLLTADVAANHFYASFVDELATAKHIITEYLPGYHPNTKLNELFHACTQKGLMFYLWDSSRISIEDSILIGSHIHDLDWRELLDKSPEFYNACLESRGSINTEIISEQFIADHYYIIGFSDLHFSDQEMKYTSVYDWIRNEHPRLFVALESKLLLHTNTLPSLDDIIDDCIGLLSGLNIEDSLVDSITSVIPNSRYYGIVPITHLRTAFNHAADQLLTNDDLGAAGL